MNEIKGRLIVYKYGKDCKQILTIYKDAWKEMNRGNYKRLFDEIMEDLKGYKWEFDNFDRK